MMKRLLLSALVLTVVSAPIAAKGGRRRKPPPVDPELRQLVEPLLRKLDDPSFHVRESATFELMAMGPKARPAVLLAKDHPSPEVRLRVRRILLHYEELKRRERMGNPSEADWPMLKRGPGRGASAGLAAVRSRPDVKWFRALPFEAGDPYLDSPLLAVGDLLVVASRQGHVAAVSRETGSIVWEVETGEPVYAAPVMAAGMVYVPGKSLVALDATKGGRRAWSWPTDYGVIAAPVVSGGLVCAVEKGEKIVGLDPATGERKWRVRLRATASAPVVLGELLILGTEEGVVALRARDGQRRWTFDTPAPVVSAPAVLPDRVVIGDEARNLYALDAERGREVWHRRIPEGHLVETASVYGDSILFSTSGATFRALSAADGSDLWARFVGTAAQSSPCVAGGLVYFTGGPELYALEVANGDDLWRLPLIGRFSSPILVDGRLYVLARDGVLLCLE